MIGPTGVGKTEIARRLAQLAQSPFLKVEASKFTEVGYVGRDVESMIRDLTQLAINMVTREEQEGVQEKAAVMAEERLLDLLLPRPSGQGGMGSSPASNVISLGYEGDSRQDESRAQSTRERFREMLRQGDLDDRVVELSVSAAGGPPVVEVFSQEKADQEDEGARSP
jgi:ATP-dependent HslUV protease ATP-binding subunit HslU